MIGERDDGAVQLPGLDRQPRDEHVQRKRRDRDSRQPALAGGDEEERERDRDSDRGGHPEPEERDQPPELVPGFAAVLRPQHGADDAVADEREDSRRGRHRRERDPGGADDVLGGSPIAELTARERDARDEPERRSGHRDEARGDEVGVREGRDGAGTQLGDEAKADDEDALEDERQRDSARQLGEPAADRTRPKPAE